MLLQEPDIVPALLPRQLKLTMDGQSQILILDLFHRDAFCHSEWAGLFPREFGTLWRLCESPYQLVSRMELLRSVWRLGHDPQTKRVEVAITRIRSKLARFGLAQLIETGEDGGYRLVAKVQAVGLDDVTLDELMQAGYLRRAEAQLITD